MKPAALEFERLKLAVAVVILRHKPADISIGVFVTEYAQLFAQFRTELDLETADPGVAVQRALALMRWWQRRAIQCSNELYDRRLTEDAVAVLKRMPVDALSAYTGLESTIKHHQTDFNQPLISGCLEDESGRPRDTGLLAKGRYLHAAMMLRQHCQQIKRKKDLKPLIEGVEVKLIEVRNRLAGDLANLMEVALSPNGDLSFQTQLMDHFKAIIVDLACVSGHAEASWAHQLIRQLIRWQSHALTTSCTLLSADHQDSTLNVGEFHETYALADSIQRSLFTLLVSCESTDLVWIELIAVLKDLESAHELEKIEFALSLVDLLIRIHVYRDDDSQVDMIASSLQKHTDALIAWLAHLHHSNDLASDDDDDDVVDIHDLACVEQQVYFLLAIASVSSAVSPCIE